MYTKSLITALVTVASLSSGVAAAGNNNGAAAANNGGTQLNPAAIASGSAQDGSQGASAGQANSLTSTNNFINQCAGKVLTNGLQQVGGSCNGIVMGDIPPQSQTPSTIITSPQNGQNVAANQDLTMVANIQKIQTGTFTNPDSTYYSAPQQLNAQQQIIGHTHFTVQDMGATTQPQAALDATKFAFFKGVDGAADGQGNVAVTIQGGLPAGNYRACTMAGAANHQPVMVAAAQRGAQDDCIRFTVGGAGGAGAGAAQGGANNAGAAAAQNSQAAAAQGQNAAAQQGNGKKGKNGKNGKNGQKGQNGQGQNGQNGQNGQGQNGQNGQNGQGQNGQNGQQGQGQGQRGQKGQQGQQKRTARFGRRARLAPSASE